MAVDEKLGKRLATARVRAGIKSQAKVADFLEVTRCMITQWETGVNVPEARLQQMAKLYGVTVFWLKTGEAAGDVAEIQALLGKADMPTDAKGRILDFAKSVVGGGE